MKEFKDRVVVMTGGASCIGRALNEVFAAEGMRVVIADVEETSQRQTEDEMKSKRRVRILRYDQRFQTRVR